MQCQCAFFCTLENGPQAAEDVLWLKRQPPVLFHGNNVGHRIIITISLSFRPTNSNSHNVNLQPFYAAYSYLIAWRYASPGSHPLTSASFRPAASCPPQLQQLSTIWSNLLPLSFNKVLLSYLFPYYLLLLLHTMHGIWVVRAINKIK